MTHYTIMAERDGAWWSLQAKELPGAISQVRKIEDVTVIKEALAFLTGEPEKEISISVEILESGLVDSAS
ncbi:MAG TPA: hypothetical protein VIB80_00850 [Aquiluna sp.]